MAGNSSHCEFVSLGRALPCIDGKSSLPLLRYYSSSMASCLPACRGGVSKGVPEDASGGSLDFELAPARCPAAAWVSHLLHNCLEGGELLREARKGPGSSLLLTEGPSSLTSQKAATGKWAPSLVFAK